MLCILLLIALFFQSPAFIIEDPLRKDRRESFPFNTGRLISTAGMSPKSKKEADYTVFRPVYQPLVANATT